MVAAARRYSATSVARLPVRVACGGVRGVLPGALVVQLEAIHRFQTEGGRKSINTPNEEPLDPLGHGETLYLCTPLLLSPHSLHFRGAGGGAGGAAGRRRGGEEQEEQGEEQQEEQGGERGAGGRGGRGEGRRGPGTTRETRGRGEHGEGWARYVSIPYTDSAL